MATEKSTPALTIVALACATPRRQPYFMPVAGQDDLKLGFRKMPDTGAESWLAQWPDAAAASGRKEVSLRGKATDYDSAVKAAIKAHAAAKASLVDTGMTVKQLCAAYADLVEEGNQRLQLKVKIVGPRPATATKMRALQRRYITGSACDPSDERGYAVDPIAHVKLRNLTEAMCAAWRKRVLAQAAEKGQTLSDATLNKELQVLRAPLNWGADVKKDEHLQSRVWKGALEKLDTEAANAKRELLLSHDDRKAIADKAGPALKLLMKFLLLMSVRPGAASKLKVSSLKFNPTGDSVLTMGPDKTRVSSHRVIFVPLATAKWIKDKVIGDRIGNVPLLTRDDGKAWTAREWGRAFKKARNAAFPRYDERRAACIYTLRHCAITDLVEAGVAALDVAHMSGTSIKMIQEVYFHNRARNENNGLARLVVNF